MDGSSAPFKSPRPPAPRKARGGTLSRQSSRQSLRDELNAQDEAVPPLPAVSSASVGLGMNMAIAGDSSSINRDAVNNSSIAQSTSHNGQNGTLEDAFVLHDNENPGKSTSSNGGSNSKNNNNATTTAAVLARLEGLLVAKSNEIQLAGRLGEALLSQQAELENRIRELEDEVRKSEDHASVFGGSINSSRDARSLHNNNKAGHHVQNDDDSDVESAALIDERVKEKLHELESEMMKWEKGNEEIYKEVGVPSGTSSELVRQASSASMRTEQTSTPSMPKSTSQNALNDAALAGGDNTPLSPSQSRRQRNAQHRANDIEFATEIGQSLLVEVRRLQALLTERDAQLAASKVEKDGMERSMESLASGLKSVEDSLDKYREENWNLEVQNQEVRTQLTELSSNYTKSESERNRLSKELSSAREALDGHKVDNERLASQLETMKNKHETDMANMRRMTAGLQREKTDLQTALEAAKNELALRARGIRRSVSATSNNTLTTTESHQSLGGMAGDLAEEDEDEEDDVFGTGRRGIGRRKTNDHLLDSPSAMFSDADSSLDAASPAFKNISESEKLRGNLAHAQKTIQTLRAALTREKEAKMMLKRKLGKGLDGTDGEAELSDEDEDELEEDEDDEEEVDENKPEKRRRTITAATARRGRGGRGGIVASRRGALVGRLPRGTQPSRLSSEVPSVGDESADASIIEHHMPRDISMSSEQEELASLPGEDDMHQGHGPASLFSGSVNSLAGMDPAFADILPTSRSRDVGGDLARGSTRDNRPNSMMFANDLNLMEQIKRQEEEIERLKALPVAPEPVETKEMAIMTDEIVPIKVEVREFSIQTEPEPVKEVKNLAVQTDAEPVKAVKDLSMQTVPEPIKEVKHLSMQTVPEPVMETKELSMQTVPEPVKEVKEVSLQTLDESKTQGRNFAVQTDAQEVQSPKEIPVPVPVVVAPPAKETKSFAMQTEVPEVHTAEIATMTVIEPAIVTKNIEMMTIPEPVTATKDVEIMTVPEAVAATKDVEVMTTQKDIGDVSTQTDLPVEESKPVVEAVPLPVKNMVDIGLDPHFEWTSLLKHAEHDGEASGNLSAMSFTGNDHEATTPTLESTPTFSTKALPDEAELIAPDVPESSYSHKMRRDDSSISHSFKSFSMRDTDYDTAAETDGDFEDARDTLATFDTASPGLTKFANMSQSTIMHSARASSLGSDGESEESHRPPTRYRRASRTRSREPTMVKDDPPPLPKPVMVEIGVQTDIIPTTMVTSPTMTPGFVARELPNVDSTPANKRLSVTSYGDTTVDSSDTARPAPPAGLIFLETVSPVAPAPPNSAATSLSPAASVPDAETASAPVSPIKARTPKLSIPPPPANPPSRETMKHSMSPTFKPPRPSSPPPKDLLQRAQTPTFLAPGSVSKKRASALQDGQSTPGTPGQYGSMPFHRNEAHFGASPAPLPRNRQPSQPRSTQSSNQLRSSTPGIRYQAASTDPSEFGRQGAVTPINQMAHPPSRYGSTRRRREQGHSSRASMSSMGSAHSRTPSMASSARTSDAGLEGLPTPAGAGLGSGAGVAGSTDPAVIHAITQAMIGEFLFKYTRTTFTKGHSDKRHQRFFWIHPYTKTLYWSNSDPGAEGVNQSKAKSVFIAGVRVETDANPYPPGLYQKSIVVSTIGREIKLTAPTKERHEMWMMAINYLLARADGPIPTSALGAPGTPSSRFSSLGRSVNRSAASLRFRQKSDPLTLSETGVLVPSNGSGTNATNDSTVVPRSRAGKNTASMYQQESRSEAHLTATKKARKMSNATSLYKRSDTPAAEYENFIAEYGSPRSVRSYKTNATAGPSGKGVDESLEIIDRRDVIGAEDGYEGLENVRACCDGAHDVGKLSVSKKHHHHQHHGHTSQGQGYDYSTVRSSAGRSNSVASKASRRTGRFSNYGQEPPVPSLNNEPASPSTRDGSHSTTLRGLSSSLGSPSKATQRGSASINSVGTTSQDSIPFKA